MPWKKLYGYGSLWGSYLWSSRTQLNTYHCAFRISGCRDSESSSVLYLDRTDVRKRLNRSFHRSLKFEWPRSFSTERRHHHLVHKNLHNIQTLVDIILYKARMDHCPITVPFSLVHHSFVLAHGGYIPDGSSPASFRSRATTPCGGTLYTVKFLIAVPLSVWLQRSCHVFNSPEE